MLDAVAKLIDNETAAILVEPIQGEGGINIAAGRLSGEASRNWPTSTICS